MRIAIAQIEVFKGDIEKNLVKHIYWVNKAIEKKADLIVFPELSVSGYEPALAQELSTTQNDVRFNVLQELSNAHRISICAGVPTGKKQNVHISMIIFQPNKDRLTYSKRFLHHSEEAFFSPGNLPIVIKIKDETIAPAICYELSRQEHHQFAVENQANIYMASVLNSVEGVDSDLIKLQKLAAKHQIIAMMSNFVGVSGGYNCGGRSSVWNSKGELVAQLNEQEEGILVFDTVEMQLV